VLVNSLQKGDGMDEVRFSKIKTLIRMELSDAQKADLRVMLDGLEGNIVTQEERPAVLELALEAQGNYLVALMNVTVATGGLVSAALCNNGPDTRSTIDLMTSELHTQLHHFERAVRDAEARKVDGAPFEKSTAEAWVPIWRELIRIADHFNASEGSDADLQELRQAASRYNSRLTTFSKPLTSRGTRNPNSNQSKVRARIDAKIYELYTSPSAGYAQTALNAMAALRSAGDIEAANYIDARKNKKQFAIDARKREIRKRKKSGYDE
jgi:hypothetical protein